MTNLLPGPNIKALFFPRTPLTSHPHTLRSFVSILRLCNCKIEMVKMARLQGIIIVVLAIISVTLGLGGKPVGAQVRHVVGGDRGWDPSSDIASWSSDKTFRVGDEIWFTYSVAQGLVAELQSKEEYDSCDLTNPIKMYTDGLHTIPLEKEGIKYFASTDIENCKNGLKLHVDVLPRGIESPRTTTVSKRSVADGPSSPSGSAHYVTGYRLTLIFLMLYVTVGLAY